MLNSIKKKANQEDLPSHILNIKLTNQGSNYLGTKIRSFLHEKLNGVPYQKNVSASGSTTHVSITWSYCPRAGDTSQYYSATVQLYSDLAVVLATRMILTDILGQLQQSEKNESHDYDDVSFQSIVNHNYLQRIKNHTNKSLFDVKNEVKIDWMKFGLAYIISKPCSMNFPICTVSQMIKLNT